MPTATTMRVGYQCSGTFAVHAYSFASHPPTVLLSLIGAYAGSNPPV
jgi:hypothetical protein